MSWDDVGKLASDLLRKAHLVRTAYVYCAVPGLRDDMEPAGTRDECG